MGALGSPAPSRHWSRPFLGSVPGGLLIACAFSGGVHLELAPEHLHESIPLGIGFLAAAILLFALGLGIYLRPDSAALALLIAVLSGTLIAAYVASRTVGLPLLHPAPEAVDPVGVITKAVEAVALVLSLCLLLEPAAGDSGCREKGRSRWTTIPAIRRAGS